MRTATRSFAGANIKGTPAMNAASVRNDVRKISKLVDVFVVQEFRWRWYWTTIRSLLGIKWGSFPAFVKGIAAPTAGGQGVFWKRSAFKKVHTRVSEAFNFALDNSGIMENRWIRAALLADRPTGLGTWFVSTHFVVHGDSKDDPLRRREFMANNLQALNKMLQYLTRTDAPIIFEGDLNIHKGSQAYADLMVIVNKYHGRIVGTHGVEFLIVFDAHCATKVVVTKVYSLDPKAYGLRTDHEVRCIDFHLDTA